MQPVKTNVNETGSFTARNLRRAGIPVEVQDGMVLKGLVPRARLRWPNWSPAARFILVNKLAALSGLPALLVGRLADRKAMKAGCFRHLQRAASVY